MAANSTAQHSKSNSPTFRSVRSVYLVHLPPAPATDVAPTVEEEVTRVLIHAHALVLGRALRRVRVLGPGLDHGPGPHGTVGGAILTSPRGMAGMVGGAEVGSELVEEAEGEAVAVDIVKALGLVLNLLVGVLAHYADGRQAMSVAGLEGVERGRLRTLCALVAHGRDLTLVHVPALHVLARERAPCLTLPTRGTVGVGAGVARVLGL